MLFGLCALSVVLVFVIARLTYDELRIRAILKWSSEIADYMNNYIAERGKWERESDRVQGGHTRMITRLVSQAKDAGHFDARLDAYIKLNNFLRRRWWARLDGIRSDLTLLSERVDSVEKKSNERPKYRLSLKRVDQSQRDDDDGDIYRQATRRP